MVEEEPRIPSLEAGVVAGVVEVDRPRYPQYPAPLAEAAVEEVAAADRLTDRLHVRPLPVASVMSALESCQG